MISMLDAASNRFEPALSASAILHSMSKFCIIRKCTAAHNNQQAAKIHLFFKGANGDEGKRMILYRFWQYVSECGS